ncbi:hypothetical protein [Streptomyces thermoalcalitolerans]|uniref:Uncharacterized protein n=1 Tax=Streptomyces thermoalcalitolerans TaxID=65605 RepID=A0ABN1ND52_9ACTN
MLGRTVARQGVGFLSARLVRGLGAAVIAVAGLIAAANAGPAQTPDPVPAQEVAQSD